MALMGMVEMIANQIVDVVSVRHGFVATPRTMRVTRFMSATEMLRRAGGGVPPADFDRALVDVVAVHRVQATVVEVIDVVSVADGGMPASFAMDVRMLRMDFVLRHSQSSVISETPGKG